MSQRKPTAREKFLLQLEHERAEARAEKAAKAAVAPAHPAAALFPMLPEDELRELAGDIAEHGLLQPIIIYQGMVLDGRNRQAACKLAGVEVKSRTLGTCPSPTAFVLSTNLQRRHLTPAQRAAIAAESHEFFAAEAKERQRKHGATAPGRRANTSGQSNRKCSGEAVVQAAKAVGAGVSATKAMVAIKRDAPEVFQKVKAGEVATVAEAKRLARPENVPAAAENSDLAPELVRSCRRVVKLCDAMAKPRTPEQFAGGFRDVCKARDALVQLVKEIDDWFEAARDEQPEQEPVR